MNTLNIELQFNRDTVQILGKYINQLIKINIFNDFIHFNIGDLSEFQIENRGGDIVLTYYL